MAGSRAEERMGSQERRPQLQREALRSVLLQGGKPCVIPPGLEVLEQSATQETQAAAPSQNPKDGSSADEANPRRPWIRLGPKPQRNVRQIQAPLSRNSDSQDIETRAMGEPEHKPNPSNAPHPPNQPNPANPTLAAPRFVVDGQGRLQLARRCRDSDPYAKSTKEHLAHSDDGGKQHAEGSHGTGTEEEKKLEPAPPPIAEEHDSHAPRPPRPAAARKDTPPVPSQFSRSAQNQNRAASSSITKESDPPPPPPKKSSEIGFKRHSLTGARHHSLSEPPLADADALSAFGRASSLGSAATTSQQNFQLSANGDAGAPTAGGCGSAAPKVGDSHSHALPPPPRLDSMGEPVRSVSPSVALEILSEHQHSVAPYVAHVLKLKKGGSDKGQNSPENSPPLSRRSSSQEMDSPPTKKGRISGRRASVIPGARRGSVMTSSRRGSTMNPADLASLGGRSESVSRLGSHSSLTNEKQHHLNERIRVMGRLVNALGDHQGGRDSPKRKASLVNAAIRRPSITRTVSEVHSLNDLRDFPDILAVLSKEIAKAAELAALKTTEHMLEKVAVDQQRIRNQRAELQRLYGNLEIREKVTSAFAREVAEESVHHHHPRVTLSSAESQAELEVLRKKISEYEEEEKKRSNLIAEARHQERIASEEARQKRVMRLVTKIMTNHNTLALRQHFQAIHIFVSDEVRKRRIIQKVIARMKARFKTMAFFKWLENLIESKANAERRGVEEEVERYYRTKMYAGMSDVQALLTLKQRTQELQEAKDQLSASNSKLAEVEDSLEKQQRLRIAAQEESTKLKNQLEILVTSGLVPAEVLEESLETPTPQIATLNMSQPSKTRYLETDDSPAQDPHRTEEAHESQHELATGSAQTFLTSPDTHVSEKLQQEDDVRPDVHLDQGPKKIENSQKEHSPFKEGREKELPPRNLETKHTRKAEAEATTIRTERWNKGSDSVIAGDEDIENTVLEHGEVAESADRPPLKETWTASVHLNTATPGPCAVSTQIEKAEAQQGEVEADEGSIFRSAQWAQPAEKPWVEGPGNEGAESHQEQDGEGDLCNANPSEESQEHYEAAIQPSEAPLGQRQEPGGIQEENGKKETAILPIAAVADTQERIGSDDRQDEEFDEVERSAGGADSSQPQLSTGSAAVPEEEEEIYSDFDNAEDFEEIEDVEEAEEV